MRDAIIIAIASGAGLALIGWVAAQVRHWNDHRIVRRWLRANTRDGPGESHVDTITLAKGTGLPEDRVPAGLAALRQVCAALLEPLRLPGAELPDATAVRADH